MFYLQGTLPVLSENYDFNLFMYLMGKQRTT